ncbi:hypothetical protein GE061_000197 [Apolygus lucorum]|uniref:MD-2-related lipid-recognition domain-containing protein n=1 Tax=Apolygus lucorum TaxID=248454 RepID=A0A8S9Y3K6_APOLU|nr:hypothetical protein GE061_000197 [Apolygus lucorum]
MAGRPLRTRVTESEVYHPDDPDFAERVQRLIFECPSSPTDDCSDDEYDISAPTTSSANPRRCDLADYNSVTSFDDDHDISVPSTSSANPRRSDISDSIYIPSDDELTDDEEESNICEGDNDERVPPEFVEQSRPVDQPAVEPEFYYDPPLDVENKVKISACEEPPCRLRRKSVPEIRLAFRAERDLKHVRTHVSAAIAGIPFPFIGVDGTSACGKIFTADGKKKVECPLKKGQDYLYINSFKVLEQYPKIHVHIRWALTDPDTQKVISCFELPARITS